jgi:HSP20 family protein
MNRLFEESLESLELGSIPLKEWLKEWSPRLDIVETKDEMIVRVDLPGVKQSDIDISVRNDSLMIRGERKEEKETREENYYRRERAYGTFSRSIPLPSGVKAEQIKATYQDGVLEVRFPRPEETKSKQIKIEVK